MIESEVYKLSAGVYMRQLFPLYLKRKWWLFVLVALPFPVLALWNLNFLYAALMVEFFVIPMMLGLAKAESNASLSTGRMPSFQ